MREKIGQSGFVAVRISRADNADECMIPVTICDYKNMFGVDYYQVTPIGGIGKNWVTAQKIRFEDGS